MSKPSKLFLWLGLVLSLPASGYAAGSFIFYAWINAAEPERWSPERAEVWAFGALAFAILFFGLFVYCLVTLIRDVNKQNCRLG
jgi:hypothetical protein